MIQKNIERTGNLFDKKDNYFSSPKIRRGSERREREREGV